MSTLGDIKTTIAQNPNFPVSISRVKYALCELASVKDGPTVTLSDFHSVKTYQTDQAPIKDSTFVVHVFAVSLEEAEEVAEAIDTLFDTQPVTPRAVGCFQESYDVFMEAQDEYFSHVAMSYRLTENLAT